MAQWVECVLCKWDDLSSVPVPMSGTRVATKAWQHGPVSPAWGRWKRASSGTLEVPLRDKVERTPGVSFWVHVRLHESILARMCVHRHTAAPLKTTSERKSKAVPILANSVKSRLSRVGLLSVPCTVNGKPAFRRRSTRNPLTGAISKWNAQKKMP